MYYLQSRYYDPKIGRFINADAFASTGQGFFGNNMFAYCLSNPTNIVDPTGMCGYIYSIYFWSDCESKYCPNSKKYNTQTTLESIFTELASPDQDGGTFSVGIAGGGTTFNNTQSGSVCLSVDSSNNYAVQTTTSYGSSAGAGGSINLVLTFTNANNVQDLAGTSESYGFTIVDVFGVTLDYITFVPASNPDTTCWGISVSPSGGAEIEGHHTYNYTTSSKSWNLWLSLRKLFYGE